MKQTTDAQKEKALEEALLPDIKAKGYADKEAELIARILSKMAPLLEQIDGFNLTRQDAQDLTVKIESIIAMVEVKAAAGVEDDLAEEEVEAMIQQIKSLLAHYAKKKRNKIIDIEIEDE